jgi:two-component system cell cycle sensor histidine kinase/response regulator CckA
MNNEDNEKNWEKQELLNELAQLRQRISGLEAEIEDLKEKEKETATSRERYRLFIKNTDDLIAVITFALNPVYTLISPSHKKIMGYDPDDLLGKQALDFVHPKDRKNLIPLLKKYVGAKAKRILTGKKPDFSEKLEYRAKDKSGDWHYLQSTINVINDELLLITRDITLQKKAEEERRDLEEKLIQTEKMEAIGALAGGVAHDLNNILSAIVNYPELLLLDLPPDSPHRKPIMAIQQAGERAAAIVTDLLTLARRAPVETEVVQFNDIVIDLFSSLEFERMKSFHPGVRIESHLEPELFNIVGSPVHLGKMLMNLVSNAVEAAGEKGKVTVSTRNRYIDKPIQGYDHEVPKGEYVLLTVADNGIGMTSEDIQKMFMPFYSKKRMGRSGTGLGMTVVWGTVKDHKGYISVKSRGGEGTKVELYFPASRKELDRKEAEISIDRYMGNGESIVVIDDVEEQRDIASMLLSQLGYTVNTAADVEEAFEILKDRSADLFILDMIMDPGLDGLDTYKKIIEKYPEAKAIIASGYSETERVKEAQRLGAGAYIRKPYTLGRLAAAVRRELERKQKTKKQKK